MRPAVLPVRPAVLPARLAVLPARMAVQAAGNRIGGVEIYGQQILCALSLLLTLAAFVYTKAVVEKQKVVRR